MVVLSTIPPSTPEARAKQAAILKSGIEQAEGKLPPGTRLFTGGGRGISPSVRESRLREAKRKLEVIRKEKQEQKRIADQLKQQQLRETRETARQEKAFSGTLAGQFKGMPILDETRFQRFKRKIKESEKRDIQRGAFESLTPFGELISQRDLPGVVRKSFRKGGELFFKTTESIRVKGLGGKPLEEKTTKRIGEQIGEAGLFFSVSPVFTTTTQLEKILQPTKIILKGVTQKIDGGLIKTDLKFITSKGKKGIARGISKVGEFKEDFFGVRTIVAGKETSKAIKFPSGKIIEKVKLFRGKEISIGIRKGEAFGQISKGISQKLPKGKIVPFVSRSLGITKGDTSLVFGEAISKKGVVQSIGIIKPPKEILKGGIESFKGGGIRTPLQKTFAKQSIVSVKNIISSTQMSLPKNIISPGFSGAGSIKFAKTILKPLPKQTQTIKEVPAQFQQSKVIIDRFPLPKQIEGLKSDQRGRTSQILKQPQLEKSKQKSRQVLGLEQLQLERLRQDIGLKQPSLLKEKTRLKTSLKNVLVTEKISRTQRNSFLPSFKPQDFGFGLPLLPPFPGSKRSDKKRIKKKKRGFKTRIRPSFTGIVADVQIGLPKITFLGGKDIGILPGQIRGIAKRKIKKKKKKK